MASSPGHIACGHVVADDRHHLRPCPVAIDEGTAAHHCDLQRREIVREDRFEVQRRVAGRALGALTFGGEARHVPCVREGRVVDRRRRRDTGNSPELRVACCQELLVPRALAVLVVRQRQLHDHERVGGIADLDRLQVHDRPHQQARRCDDGDRERHLKGDERAAHPAPGHRRASRGRRRGAARRRHRSPAAMPEARPAIAAAKPMPRRRPCDDDAVDADGVDARQVLRADWRPARAASTRPTRIAATPAVNVKTTLSAARARRSAAATHPARPARPAPDAGSRPAAG